MLDIFILVPTSLPPHLPISVSINRVESISISKIDGFTFNPLMQLYGTQAVDEDVDLELSDDELESIAGNLVAQAGSYKSDILYNGEEIVNLDAFLNYIKQEPNDFKQIEYVKDRFGEHRLDISENAARIIWNNLRAPAPVQIKREQGGFTVDLKTGELRYVNR